ncbi:hypothetical protein FAI41_00085 [Acetobacteraceae bacterium]|nr:hypothetical protein FAI41_00085 [Acetobacteraceae bacterium]
MFSLKKILAFFICVFFFSSAHASARNAEQKVVDDSTQEIDVLLFNLNNQFPSFIKELSPLRGIIFCPKTSESSTLFNKFSKGKCVLLSRDSQGGWSAPAFYNLSQEDGWEFSKEEENEFVFFIMTQKALEAFVDKDITLKKNKTLSIISLKENIFTPRVPDLYAAKFSRQSFQNMSLNIKFSSDDLANKQYYHASVEPIDILISMKVNNLKADNLRRKLMYSFSA